MDTHQTTQQILASALQLSPQERVVIADALLVSVPLEEVTLGCVESTAEVEAAWSCEIERRIDDIQNGRVETIPAEEAERVIRGKRRPGYWRARKNGSSASMPGQANYALEGQ